uniref:tyrosine-protein phosphatase non-receptor type 2 isoform X6 n=1 Tax=Panthera onca TaxID=9690 RepID=UPI0029551011|nr:tyrosine-protein phosphatase non-receptor type 2 isoform X6 [Panthera onca]
MGGGGGVLRERKRKVGSRRRLHSGTWWRARTGSAAGGGRTPGGWGVPEIRNESHDYPHRVAKFPENRNRNRYRDVSPYDHSRVKLQNAENDYINASLVDIEEAKRSYILTQGPLPNTGCHFWLMVWQQKTKAVVMLNRVVEKESVKCAQYWPTKDDREMLFKETGFSVKFLSEDVKSYYTVHLLQLENINKRWKELSKEDLCPALDHSPTKTTTEKYNGNRIGLEEEKLTGDRYTGLSSKMQDTMEENSESVLRKRIREDRKANTAQKVQQMKQRLNETERKRKRWLYWQPILTKMGFVSVILVGAFVGWTLLFQQNVL